jgi:hypothetical protein
MLTESIEKAAETIPQKMICESCGEEFSCGVNVGNCWCFAVELKGEILTQLRENFKDCLCENCLRKLATNNTNNTN